jgi:hypothetical protein
MHKKLGFLFAFLFIVILLTPFAAEGRRHFKGYIGDRKNRIENPWKYPPQTATSTSSTSSSTPTTTTPTPIPAPSGDLTAVITPPSAGEITLSAYITGYSYWDNTPAGSAEISNPVIHQKAGGSGTYNDPITLAVGHSIIDGKDILDYPAGTKFYFPYLQKYVIVEDTCGDGRTPQNGPCHTGYQGHPWLDVYVDGQNVSQSSANNCMNSITDVHTVIQNPGSNYPVLAGSITGSGCKQF